MHPAAYSAVLNLIAGIPLRGARVLELGSYDVNGSIRDLFEPAKDYVGLDRREGPGVDVVADAATWEGDGELFDVVVTTEALEHASKPETVIANAYQLLKPGGYFIATCAGPERAPHNQDGGPNIPKGEHYTVITAGDLARWLEEGGWVERLVLPNPNAGDLYVRARKSEAEPEPEPEPEKSTRRRKGETGPAEAA